MVLHGKERLLRMPQALDRPVVQVEVGDFRPLLQRIDIHTETMILGRNLNLPGGEVHHRLVAPVMAEFELIGLSTQGQTQNLVSQTDTEQGGLVPPGRRYSPWHRAAHPGRPDRSTKKRHPA